MSSSIAEGETTCQGQMAYGESDWPNEAKLYRMWWEAKRHLPYRAMSSQTIDSHLGAITPEHHEPRFVAQHLAAYAMARTYAKDRRVLEVGCGEGYGSYYLAEVAQQVIGVDLSAANVGRAGAKYHRSNVSFRQMSGTKLEFSDGTFDLVGSFQVIEHIPEGQLVRYLSEMARVLAPNGVVCVSTLNLAHNQKPGQLYEKNRFHEKEFTASELQAMLGQVFASVQLFGLHLSWPHQLCERLKKWGIDRWGPPRDNPVARFYACISTQAFAVSRNTSGAALDLIALCRKD